MNLEQTLLFCELMWSPKPCKMFYDTPRFPASKLNPCNLTSV